MIENLEIRSQSDREIIGIVDNMKSVIWHSVYYGVGDFEIYLPATGKHMDLLKHGNYITRPDDIEVGIIENIQITNDENGLMLIVTGRFAKSILDRRHIYNLSGKTNTPTILRGNVENNVRSLVSDNAISCAFDSNRNIPFLELGKLNNIPTIIVDDKGQPAQKQVSYDNLLTYSDSVLEEYRLGSTVILDDDSKKLLYIVYEGINRSIDNPDDNEAVIFSYEFDNISQSSYVYDITPMKTAALIGGEGEGLERFYSIIQGNAQGENRRETWVDASSITKTYQDESGDEHVYTDEQYTEMLNAQGKQALSTLIPTESFEGTLLVNGGVWRLNRDYTLGDVVTIEDKRIGQYANVQITEILETQDENGYTVEITYKK